MFSLFITYSRYLWVFGAFAVLSGFLVSILHKKYRIETISSDLFKINLLFSILLISLFSLFLVVLIYPGIMDVVIERFSGRHSIASDLIRKQISLALWKVIEEYPLFGKGMGSYSAELIRFDEVPWNYELQWMALLMNFGVIGVLYLVFLFFIVYRIILYRVNLVAISIATLFTFWISSAFFNCFLLSSSGGVVFLQYIIIAYVTKNIAWNGFHDISSQVGEIN